MEVRDDTKEFLRWKQIPRILIERGERLLAQPYRKIEFTKDSRADDFLNDLSNYPHAFVLGCVMDRQIKSERAWLIPYEISKEVGGFDFLKFLALDLNETRRIFTKKRLHRFNDIMAQNFYLATKRIHASYEDCASSIWKNKPSSAKVVRQFLRFDGVGIKIATMAANILARDFKIPMNDKLCIDISPDRLVKRVFLRLGLIDENATNDELIYAARELNPEYPGIFDLSAWQIGRNWCKPTNPRCNMCYLESYCPKIL